MASRRRILLGAAVATPLAAWLARPAVQGGPHPAYFQRLSQALREAGVAQARMVIDLPRLRANLAAIGQHTARTGMPLRGVLKSLPSLPLMDELARAWASPRVMAFNAAQLQQLLGARPQAQALLGKPLPVAAAAQVLAALPADVGSGIEWLVDTPERLAQYRQLAEHRHQDLRLNLEIDVGLHRGGFEDADAIGQALAALRAAPALHWSGFMGYDAHVAALPDLPGMRAHAWDDLQRRWQAAWAAAGAALGPQRREGLTLNTAGSPTFRLHDGRGVANEVSVGSAALLPLDFDKPLLADLQPAAFIATPVLKSWPRFRLPEGATWLSAAASAWDRNQARAVAIHGGHWLAEPVSPPGLRPSGLYGHSSNQQVMVASERVELRPDDHVFFRPLQSEAVLLQFGDLLLFDGERISGSWPVLPASA
ncbi:alanine racemase [Roseateles saccharophilus]|uniref:D-serine deaminase-like pyridoxal phosphate-dependent protein n=1 Tax=Roseateles saccharophilus TaxID=304 RepID=A0A4R3UW16_ROSSA|nr:alanine racemase [Roseateles saccharophilus]MDG0832702.1 DSD1 family PLP-dependent enzyme [Roseateles saccharophilus]TCU95362.1 D-serine deaminase-like pyridoxal phosphate-dependent protein [Roseateles saccharophilus]